MKRQYVRLPDESGNDCRAFAYSSDPLPEYLDHVPHIIDTRHPMRDGTRFLLILENEQYTGNDLAPLERRLFAYFADAITPAGAVEFLKLDAPEIAVESDLDSLIREYCAAWGIPVDDDSLDLGGAFGMEFSDFDPRHPLPISEALGRMDATWARVGSTLAWQLAEEFGLDKYHTGGGCMALGTHAGPVRLLWGDEDGTGIPQVFHKGGISVEHGDGRLENIDIPEGTDLDATRAILARAIAMAREWADLPPQPQPPAPFATLRAALLKVACDAMDANEDAGKPDSDFAAHMVATVADLRSANTVEDLARVEWVTGQAALGEERRNPSPEDAPHLARAFARRVRDITSESELAEIVRRNRDNESGCATAEFWDSNETMDSAWRDLFGAGFTDWKGGTEEPPESHFALFNDAWEIARRADFDL